MKTINKWIDDFRLGNNLMFGVWVLIFSGLIIIVVLPWAYTRSSFLPSFDQSGQIGDTFNGIAGPFIALLVALLTYLAFYVQFQSNQEQKKQFERQNQDQVFFKLLDALETRIINSSFKIHKNEIKSFQLIEHIVNDLLERMKVESIKFSRNLLYSNPGMIDDKYLIEIFKIRNRFLPNNEEYLSNNFVSLKSKFLKDMNTSDLNERWETLKVYIGEVGQEDPLIKDLLNQIASFYFYKIDFEHRSKIYQEVFKGIDRNYGSFLDGYIRSWEFLNSYIKGLYNEKTYIKILSSQLSKFEMLILFYYLGSGYANLEFKIFVQENDLFTKLYYYNSYLLHSPSQSEIEEELKLILS